MQHRTQCYDDLFMHSPHLKHLHLFALVRYDLPIDHTNWQSAVSVIKVFTNREDAEAEVRRLTLINDPSKCVYEVQTTRLVNGI
jgi:hypothetical protein